MKWLYLWLDIFAFAGPFFLSFDKKVAFYKNWRFLFPAIACMMLVFIPWDSIFTAQGIWGFNSTYTLGHTYAYLPIEEWLFFPATHYACVFIYECLNTYVKKDILKHVYVFILWGFVVLGLAVLIFYPTQLYSSLKMGGCAMVLLLTLLWFKPTWLSKFTLCYLVTLIPFLLMNGILTGSFIDAEIVWYNPNHIFNVRVGTIPVEDLFYNMFMLLTTVLFYEWFKRKYKTSAI